MRFFELMRVDHLRVGALPELSFGVPSGECLAVEGPSGSGKTRLLRAIADLDPSEGYVYLDGAERCEMPAPQWRRNVRYVSAEPAWWADTVRDHIAKEHAPRAERMVQSLGLDASILDRNVGTLSTGERQRLALARALADEPRVILLDEPTSALDGEAAALVEQQIQFLTLSGRIVILVSHDVGLSERLAHARLILAAAKREDADPLLGPIEILQASP